MAPRASTLALSLLAFVSCAAAQSLSPGNHTAPKIPPPLGPTPPRQTSIMAAQMAAVEKIAAQASLAAKPRVLALLAEPGFVAALKGCCPELVGKTCISRRSFNRKNVELMLKLPLFGEMFS